MIQENIYVLELSDKKYYIGKTADIGKRVADHAVGKGSNWSKIHKLRKIIAVYPVESMFDEDKYTLIYMEKYGIDNVRGGSFSSVELPDFQVKCIERSICHAKGLCYKCKGSGHFSNKCSDIESLQTITVDIYTKRTIFPRSHISDHSQESISCDQELSEDLASSTGAT